MTDVPVPTSAREQMVDITRAVQEAVTASGVRDGLCTVQCLHTTAGLTINENADPDVVHDLLLSLEDMVKDLRGFRHAEGNSTAHVKSSLMGVTTCAPVRDGRLVLGTWQAIYFCEFDGPRTRRVTVTVLPAHHEGD